MDAIAAWLQGLGLERYASAFQKAEIDVDTVALLTDEDLREMGLPLGPRRRILAGRGGAAETPADPEEPQGLTIPERRQLTVMFADLVGSTALSVQLDPEDLNELLTRYRHAVVEQIQHHGGTAAKYMGDGVLAYFGWPIAREDAAEQAIRAAFAAIHGVGEVRMPDGVPLQCRIGIATGLAVVGGVTGTGTAREDQVAGEPLNLAARLQVLAEPDAVVVAESTYRLAGQRFTWRSLGEHEVRGFDAPVRVWQALAELVHASRFRATRIVRSALVGRDEELGLLKGRWRETRDGTGAAVLIVGEAGVGKSRLCEALGESVGAEAAATVQLQCSSFHQNNSLYPLIDYLASAAEIVDADEPAARLDKLSRLLSRGLADNTRVLPFFADLLSIPISAGYTLPTMAPTQRRAATIAALVEWLADLADSQPLLLILEDAHWADATTLDLTTRLVGMVGRMSTLILVTSRPEFSSPWSGRPRVDVIGLDRLRKEACEQLISSLTSAQSMQTDTVDQILAKADGNPLFLEELTLAVLNAGSRIEAQLVPDSLQSSLMARLDGLGDAKRVAQTAAVLGRRFARPLLAKVSGLEPHLIDTNLSLLVASDIIHPLGRLSEGRYGFKHALVCDAAYNSLLKSARRTLHARCALLLERDFPDAAQSEPELVAHHFAEAGQPDRSSAYHEAAGDRAAARFSFEEAIASYVEAVRQVELTPPGEARDRRVLALLLKLGPAQCIIDGPHASSVRETYDRAQPIARELGDFDSLFKASWGLWFNANVGRRLTRAATLADELVALSASGDDGHVLEGLHCRWSSALFRGAYGASIDDAGRGRGLYDRERHHRLGPEFGGHDPGVCAHCVLGVSLIFVGAPEEALPWAKAALALAEVLDHPHSMAHALQNNITAACVLRDHVEVAARAGQMHALATRFNFPPLRLLSNHMLGWAEAQAGDADAGIARMAADFEAMVATSPMPIQYTALYADEVARAGRPADALAIIETQLDRLGRPNAGHYLSEFHRIRGDCLGALQRDAEATGAYVLAEKIADLQAAAWLKLRIARSRARSSTAGDDVRATLAATLSCIRTTRDWPDLIEARAVLSG